MAMEGVVVKTENDSDEEWGALSAVKKEPDCDWEATVKLENELMLETDACEALSAGFPPDGRQYAPQQNRTPITVPEICTIIYPDKISIKSEPVFVEEAVITPTTDPLSCEPTDTFSVDPLKCESADLYVDPLKCEPEDSPSADPLHLEPAGVETKDPKKDFPLNVGPHITPDETASLTNLEKHPKKFRLKLNAKSKGTDGERPTSDYERDKYEPTKIKVGGGYEGTALNIMTRDTTIANAENRSFALGTGSNRISTEGSSHGVVTGSHVMKQRLAEIENCVASTGRVGLPVLSEERKSIFNAKRAELMRRTESEALKAWGEESAAAKKKIGWPRASEEHKLARKALKAEPERPRYWAPVETEKALSNECGNADGRRKKGRPKLPEEQRLANNEMTKAKAAAKQKVKRRNMKAARLALAAKCAADAELVIGELASNFRNDQTPIFRRNNAI